MSGNRVDLVTDWLLETVTPCSHHHRPLSVRVQREGVEGGRGATGGINIWITTHHSHSPFPTSLTFRQFKSNSVGNDYTLWEGGQGGWRID